MENPYPGDFIKLKSPSGSEDVHYSTFYEGLPEEYRLLAQETLNETDHNKREGLKKLKAFMEKENLDPCSDYDLIGVLRYSKYDIKKAETKLKKFLKFRQNALQFLANMDEKKSEFILEDLMFGFLPYRDKHGRVILFAKPNLRLDLYNMDDVMSLFFAALLFLFSFPLTTVCGITCIMEGKADKLHVFYPIFKSFWGSLRSFMDMPLRHGRVDYVNANTIVNCFYAAFSLFLPDKLTKRVFFHAKGYEGLKKYYHPDILPEDFGGNLEPINNNFNKQNLFNFFEKLKNESKSNTNG